MMYRVYADYSPEELEEAEELIFNKSRGYLELEIYRFSKDEYFADFVFVSSDEPSEECGIRMRLEKKMSFPFCSRGEYAYCSLKEWDALYEGMQVDVIYHDARISLDDNGHLYVTVVLDHNNMEMKVPLSVFNHCAKLHSL